jgi:DNA-binding transcriptional regulator YhcF (GntR family)
VTLRDPDSAIYRRIAASLRERIRTGQLRPGEPIGAAGDLAYEFGVNAKTITAAIGVLRSEWLVSAPVPGQVARVRDRAEKTQVLIPKSATIEARPPTADEMVELDIPADVSVLVVTSADAVTMYAADRTLLVNALD